MAVVQLPHDLEEADQEAAGAAGRVAYDVAFLRVHHAHHELDNGARREKLADLAPEGLAEETLEGNALDVFTGVGQVVALEKADDLKAGADFRFRLSSFAKMRSAW